MSKSRHGKLDETKRLLEESLQSNIDSNKSAGMNMIKDLLHSFTTHSLTNTFFLWHFNHKQGKVNGALEEALEETEMAKAGSGMRMVRERFKQWLKDASSTAVSNWRVNQLDAEGRSVRSDRPSDTIMPRP